jgi:hypothetical protein
MVFPDPQDLEVKESFDWSKIIVLPQVEPYWLHGRQVLNFYPCDKYYEDKEEVKAFVNQHLMGAKPIDTDAGHLRYASDSVALDGFYLEMGVCTGRTINFIAALNPEKVIYGFDSFKGLNVDWNRKDVSVPKSTFAFKDSSGLPAVLHNVRLIKGLFEKTLRCFRKMVLNNQPIAFIHIDCDLYDPTKVIFDELGDNLVSGSVIVFDEYYNYPNFEENEYKAFQEFLSMSRKKARPIAFNQYFEQASFVIE